MLGLYQNFDMEQRQKSPATGISVAVGFWEDAVMNNIDDEHERLVEHFREESEEFQNHQETPVSESSRTDMSAWSCKSCNQELTSELAILCREAIKGDLKEIRAEVLAEAAEADSVCAPVDHMRRSVLLKEG
ncbi:hypothetical protein NECAME_08320 [Necator americanus]|uniref:Uncharacterized protein n=1 Tax=Necator americanus TaxID=51031 RepID=W2THY8_NECAM|nr:hypothetical protein NECAME_08320 [Necator americanus]ETN81695.1 hypothetical protein NECAME_08320 [Necator americanus]